MTRSTSATESTTPSTAVQATTAQRPTGPTSSATARPRCVKRGSDPLFTKLLPTRRGSLQREAPSVGHRHVGADRSALDAREYAERGLRRAAHAFLAGTVFSVPYVARVEASDRQPHAAVTEAPGVQAQLRLRGRCCRSRRVGPAHEAAEHPDVGRAVGTERHRRVVVVEAEAFAAERVPQRLAGA